MYDITIGNKNYEVADFYEVNNMLKKIEGPRAEFTPKFSERIEDFYEEFFLKGEKDYYEDELYRLQLLINDCFNYILDGKSDFTEYFEVKYSEKKKLDKKGLKDYKVENNIFFDPEEIAKKLNTYEMDKLDLFYYYSFTSFYLNEYLLEMFVMFPYIFKTGNFNSEELQTLNSYLSNIFSVEYSKAFRIFETSLV